MTSSELKLLAKEILSEGKELRVKALGGSMLPLFRAGDEFIIESFEPRDLNIGDIVIAQNRELLILHRVHKFLPNNRLILWGDFNRKPDTEFSYDQIFAKATRFSRNGKIVNLNRWNYQILGQIVVRLSPISHILLFYTVITASKLKKIVTSVR